MILLVCIIRFFQWLSFTLQRRVGRELESPQQPVEQISCWNWMRKALAKSSKKHGKEML